MGAVKISNFSKFYVRHKFIAKIRNFDSSHGLYSDISAPSYKLGGGIFQQTFNSP